jgi:DNA-directed RNA polymerase specialized sigma24 family protein
MAIADHCRGRVLKGHTIPYGTFDAADTEVKSAYYGYGYRNDDDMPPLPQVEPDEVVVDPEEALAKKEEQAYIRSLLDGLTRRESKVLRMRFGIDVNYDMSLEEVGTRLDVSKERIRQVEAKALRKLKHPDRRLWAVIDPEAFARQRRQDQDRLRMRMHEIEMIHQGWMWLQRQLDKGIIPTKRENVTFWIEHIRQTDNLLYNHFHDKVTERINYIFTHRLCIPHDDGGAQIEGSTRSATGA